jgi:hypothetical protein
MISQSSGYSGGALVVKVFIKPDINISLKSVHRRLKGTMLRFSLSMDIN